MSREFPDWINPWKAAEGRMQYSGTVPLADLQRLAPMLALDDAPGGQQAVATFEARFRLDRERRPWIDLSVQASLPLTCQRSLTTYLEAVDRHSTLAVISELDEQSVLPDDAEPVLVENSGLALRLLVEDELLLATPLVPRNPDIAPVQHELEAAQGSEENTRRENPFAALEAIKSSGGDSGP